MQEPFDRFFLKGAPKLSRVIVRYFKDPASQLLAFERGEIDMHYEAGEARDIGNRLAVPPPGR